MFHNFAGCSVLKCVAFPKRETLCWVLHSMPFFPPYERHSQVSNFNGNIGLAFELCWSEVLAFQQRLWACVWIMQAWNIGTSFTRICSFCGCEITISLQVLLHTPVFLKDSAEALHRCLIVLFFMWRVQYVNMCTAISRYSRLRVYSFNWTTQAVRFTVSDSPRTSSRSRTAFDFPIRPYGVGNPWTTHGLSATGNWRAPLLPPPWSCCCITLQKFQWKANSLLR